VPIKTAHLMHGMIPDARYHELPDAGHFPSVTNPREVADVLASFLSDPSDLSEFAPEAGT
jgi:pimeloyl-ACP methyl ester carboxylesterase